MGIYTGNNRHLNHTSYTYIQGKNSYSSFYISYFVILNIKGDVSISFSTVGKKIQLKKYHYLYKRLKKKKHLYKHFCKNI